MSTIPTSSVAPATTLIAFPYRYIAPSFSDVGEKIVTVGDLASIENSVISLSTLLRTISVRLIEINKSPAVVDEEIVKLWKYSGPLSGSFVFCDLKIIAVSLPPVNDSPADVVMLMIGNIIQYFRGFNSQCVFASYNGIVKNRNTVFICDSRM